VRLGSLGKEGSFSFGNLGNVGLGRLKSNDGTLYDGLGSFGSSNLGSLGNDGRLNFGNFGFLNCGRLNCGRLNFGSFGSSNLEVSVKLASGIHNLVAAVLEETDQTWGIWERTILGVLEVIV